MKLDEAGRATVGCKDVSLVATVITGTVSGCKVSLVATVMTGTASGYKVFVVGSHCHDGHSQGL